VAPAIDATVLACLGALEQSPKRVQTANAAGKSIQQSAIWQRQNEIIWLCVGTPLLAAFENVAHGAKRYCVTWSRLGVARYAKHHQFAAAIRIEKLYVPPTQPTPFLAFFVAFEKLVLSQAAVEQYQQEILHCFAPHAFAFANLGLSDPLGHVAAQLAIPFFGDKAIDTIKMPEVERYKIWRRDFWITGPGSQEKQVYMRHGKQIISNKRHKRTAPSPSTINGENTVLRSVFKYAVTQGWMTKDQMPLIENIEITRRDARERAHPVFTIAEYRQLRRYMTKWIADPKIGERERMRREAVQDFLLILFNSGLREHELFKRDEKSKEWRGLRWSDVELFNSNSGCELVIFHIAANTKTGPRDAVPLRAVRYVLERRKQRCPNAKPEDFILALPDGTLLNTFASSVRRLYTLAGLLKCPKTGKNRGIYSGRHTYATARIAARLNPAELAANMGTSIAMLERSYYHFDAKAAADRLTGRNA
jgi:hypothetical protein